jgi:hypothetical protein
MGNLHITQGEPASGNFGKALSGIGTLQGIAATVYQHHQPTAPGRYVNLYIAATMHSLKLCTVTSGFAAPAAVEAGAGAHS